MKKIIISSVVIMFVLTFGLAYAGDMTRSSDMSSSTNNGITIFATGSISTGVDYRVTGNSGKSEISSRTGELSLNNGATLFALGPVSTGIVYKVQGTTISGEEGSAAGGYMEMPSMEPQNGVTVFDTHAVGSR